jgi:hypothetical protein
VFLVSIIEVWEQLVFLTEHTNIQSTIWHAEQYVCINTKNNYSNSFLTNNSDCDMMMIIIIIIIIIVIVIVAMSIIA